LGLHLGFVHLNGSIPLPWKPLSRLPFLNNLLPERLSLFVALFVAVLVAIGIAEVSRSSVRPRPGLHHMSVTRPASGRRLLVAGLGVLALISLVPNWPIASLPARIPLFFRSDLVKQIPVGTVVLTYPFPVFPENQAMSWQAASDMRFKLVGGYALFRAANGRASAYPSALTPVAVERYLVYMEMSDASGKTARALAEQAVRAIPRYISANGVGAVIVDVSDPTIPSVASVVALFTRALGQPVRLGGVALWLDPLGSRGAATQARGIRVGAASTAVAYERP
jgi:hypothetical protein